MTAAAARRGRPAWASEIEVVTLDFGNTLVPVDRAGLERVVAVTAEAIDADCGPFPPGAFLAAWAEERERQFREELPRFREVDLRQRVARVLARLRGLAPPDEADPWDAAAVAGRSTATELDDAIDVYSRSFVEAMPPPAATAAALRRLAGRRRLAILSNWPLAVTIDRYLEAAGWAELFDAVVVSQRVGSIKPRPEIFRAAAAALGDPAPTSILHVGDDWLADVAGPKAVGWRAALVMARPADSPLPSSTPDGSVEPDLIVADLAELADTFG